MNPESQYTPGGGQGQFQPQPSMQPPYQPQQPVPQPGYAPLPPANIPPVRHRASKLWVILTFVFLFTTLVGAGLGVWALINYFDQKNNVDSKVTAAVATAVKEQQDADAANFLEQEKQPNRQFVGPEDYGRLAFDYPKTWSVYVDQDALQGGDYTAYFNPVSVPPVRGDKQQFALRVSIVQQDYDAVVQDYASLVSEGELKSTSVSADGQNGTRLDGNFTEDLRGSAVLFKIRDKTVTIQTDAQTFEGDFNALIKTITFNK